MTEPIRIIAEGEINHNGDVELAKKLVETAHACKADFIKFQCFVADNFIAPGSSFLPIFKENELSLDEFRAIKAHAAKVGVTFISTASDLAGLRMIVDLDLPIIKLGSTNITNTPLLEGIAETGKPVILSTGASTLAEVAEAVEIVARGTDDITLMHCTATYPAADDALNLSAIPTMAAAFPGIPVGYSDHSPGTTAAIAAIGLGARLLEKHFTTDKSLPGPDHAISSSPEELAEYIETAHRVATMLGSPEKRPAETEAGIRRAGRRYLTAVGDIPAGAVLDDRMIRPRRVDVANVDVDALLPPSLARSLVGWTARRALRDGEPLGWRNLRPTD